jgi:anti-sigma regulatory factor (Ser/Thr protein kinase)
VTQAASTFPGDNHSVPVARRFVAETLRAWGASRFEWAATTLISELATNSVLHARTAFTVVLRLGPDVLRLEVTDGSARLPQQRHYGIDATTGRGLTLVHDLSGNDGVDVSGQGKTVWCELRADGAGRGADDELILPSENPGQQDVSILTDLMTELGEPDDVQAEPRGLAA